MRRRRLWGHGVPEAAVVPLQRLETAEQSIVWITASEDGASATCVGVAPACKELRSGPNKSEREPTSARSTNYGSGHLIPAFHGTGRTFSLLPSHPLDAASGSIDAPLVSCLRGKVPRPKMVSSNQKRFQLCFVRNSPWGTSEPRVFHPKREPRPSPPRWGAGSREPSFGGVRRAFVTRAPFRKFTGAAKTSSRKRRAVGFLRHLANILARSHCWAIFLFECHN